MLPRLLLPYIDDRKDSYGKDLSIGLNNLSSAKIGRKKSSCGVLFSKYCQRVPRQAPPEYHLKCLFFQQIPAHKMRYGQAELLGGLGKADCPPGRRMGAIRLG